MSVAVSVLMCTRNRPEDIVFALPSVLSNVGVEYEVLVVDQSDDDRTAQFVRSLQNDHPHLRYLSTKTRGLSRARNLAIQEARGQILAFTDDDCETGTDWLATMVRLFEEDPEMAILFGRVQAPENVPAGAVVPCLYFNKRIEMRGGRILGMGANMAFRRDVPERLGPFDEALGGGAVLPGGEDFDFSFRAQRAGLKVVADPRLTLTHKSYRDARQWQRVVRLCGEGDAAFYIKHVRCGDSLAVAGLAVHFLRHFRRLVREIARNARHTPAERRTYNADYVGALLRGSARCWRYRVDRRRRVYIVP